MKISRTKCLIVCGSIFAAEIGHGEKAPHLHPERSIENVVESLFLSGATSTFFSGGTSVFYRMDGPLKSG